MSSAPKEVDIAIVGGGLVGATLACALSSLSYRVAVIEAFAFGSTDSPSFDDRSVALSYGSALLMKQMGLWQAIAPQATAIDEIQVSEKGRFGLTRMSAAEEEVEALGYVVENRVLGAVFQEQMATRYIHWIAPAKVISVEAWANQVDIHWQGADDAEPQRLQCRLMVAADGANSQVREQMGISASTTDYGLSAIIANVQTQLPHKGKAYERFTDTGPLAFLPLGHYQRSHRSTIVWTVRHDELDDMMALDDEVFLQRLQQRFGQRLGRLLKAGKRQSYPVSLTRALRCTAQRTVVLGNAAQAINPVAGQGFNLALRDVACLLDILAQHNAADPGESKVLEEYAAQRKADRRRTIWFTDGLINVFSNSITPLSHMRAGGLMLTDLVEPLRQQFVRQGMGLSGKRHIKGSGHE